MGDDMGKIVRIEDITEIVGLKNYIDALSLNQEDVCYKNAKRQNNEIIFQFQYKNYHIEISIDRKEQIKRLICDCEHQDSYCKHMAVCLIFLFSNSIISKELEKISYEYDAEFNTLLFQKLSYQNPNRIPLKLEVILKLLDYSENEYELQVKIGENKTYVLKRYIKEFYEVYNSQKGDLEFGKNFIYNPKIHYFNEVDNKIIEFLNIYLDSQIPRTGYYSYYQNISMIRLTNKSLKSFLKLLDQKDFYVDYQNHLYLFHGIKNMKLNVRIFKQDEQVQVQIQKDDFIPLLNDYSYVVDNQNMYYLNKGDRDFLKILNENKKKQLIFQKKEIGMFSNYIYPILKKLDQEMEIEEELKKEFTIEPAILKFYFDYDHDQLICTIKLHTNHQNINILENKSVIDGVWIKRDFKEEGHYKKVITDCGFMLDNKKKVYYLMGDAIPEFLENHLQEISNQYETYISSKVKNANVIKKTDMVNTFKIGKDQILSYEFYSKDIPKEEILDLLNSYVQKKKYHRLKSGDYITLENGQLENMNQLFIHLNIQRQDLLKEQIPLPVYQSIYINQFLHDERNSSIQVNQEFHNFIDQFQQYKNIEPNIPEEDLHILRDYQVTGVKWMNIISKCGFGGILADEMGLGKSIQTIEFIKSNPSSKTLIVVPTSLIYNWENEFQKFGQGLSYFIMNGNPVERKKAFQNIFKYDVVITTYGLLRNDIESYLQYSFDYCMIDEAQNIKNISSDTTGVVKRIKARTKFALTGTPIENSILELWSIFDFIMPGYLRSLSIFKQMYNIKNMEVDAELLTHLNKMITPFILRRRKIEVLKDLPEKIENNIVVELNEEQKKLYLGQLEKTKEEIDFIIRNGDVKKSSILILSLLTKLRQLCIDPRLLFEGDFESSKLTTVLEILKQVKKHHKVLLFSAFPSALKLLIPDLEKNNIHYYYLDGGTKSKQRMEMVEKFNRDDTNVFLISLKAGGTGLNLTSADIVIHLDPWWNPQVENQATDRTHRIGQKKVVEVIKLIAKGTIEEKIIDLQKRKQNLSNQIIEGDNRSIINLSKMEVDELKELIGI